MNGQRFWRRLSCPSSETADILQIWRSYYDCSMPRRLISSGSPSKNSQVTAVRSQGWGVRKDGQTMRSNRKVRFTVVILVLLSTNLALWVASRMFGYTSKQHGAVFAFVIIVDFFFFLGLALFGLLTAWLLAFRPERFKNAIERSIAKRNSS